MIAPLVLLAGVPLITAPPDSSPLAAERRGKAFYRMLSMPQPPPAAGQAAAREQVLATLQQIRR